MEARIEALLAQAESEQQEVQRLKESSANGGAEEKDLEPSGS